MLEGAIGIYEKVRKSQEGMAGDERLQKFKENEGRAWHALFADIWGSETNLFALLVEVLSYVRNKSLRTLDRSAEL